MGTVTSNVRASGFSAADAVVATAAAAAQLSAASSKHRILVCLDRTSASETCVPYAISLARTFGSALTLLHVMPPHRQSGQTIDALGWEISRQEARVYLDRIERETSQALGHPIDVRLEQGRPAERIVDLARELGADVTVLGGHGSQPPMRTLGTTAQQVISSMHGSVLVAHRSCGVSPSRILVPLDGSQRTESVLPAAARLAAAHDAQLLLVHVVQEPIATPLLHAAEGMELAQRLASRLEAAAKRYLERLQRQLALQGTPSQIFVARHVNVHQCLLEISQRERAELIVLSAHGSACDAARAFGSVTTYLLSHSPVPLLVLQDLPEAGAGRFGDVEAKLAPPPLRAGSAAESM